MKRAAGFAIVLGLLSGGCGNTGSNGAGADAGGGAGADAGPPGTDGRPDAGGTTTPDGGAAVTDPGQAGPESWGSDTQTIDVGGESIPLTIYLPDSTGPHPTIVFTHGFTLEPSMYASYGEHLASWGYAVILPKLPGSVFSSKTHRELADLLEGVLDWIDANASDTAGPLKGRVDTGALALAGHSMGGKLSLLVASEDARPKAVFGVNPVDSGSPLSSNPDDYPSVTPERMPDITVPLGLLGETVNASAGLGQACAPADDNFQQYYAYADSPAVQIEVLGANHMSFLDDPNCGFTCSACSAGTDDPATTRRLTQRYMTAFFQVVLRDQSAYAAFLTGSEMQADVSAGLVLTEHKNGL